MSIHMRYDRTSKSVIYRYIKLRLKSTNNSRSSLFNLQFSGKHIVFSGVTNFIIILKIYCKIAIKIIRRIPKTVINIEQIMLIGISIRIIGNWIMICSFLRSATSCSWMIFKKPYLLSIVYPHTIPISKFNNQRATTPKTKIGRCRHKSLTDSWFATLVTFKSTMWWLNVVKLNK